MTWIARPLSERLLSRVVCDTTTRCWQYTGCISLHGYASVRPGGRQPSVPGHRAAYELWVGPIADGKELHHICGNRGCIAPYHLQAVDRRTHVTDLTPTHITYAAKRRTHCPQGHPLTPDNLVLSVLKRGHRNCLACKRALGREYMRRKRAAA